MKFLVIETSGEDSFVALSIGVSWTQAPLLPRQQMQCLLPATNRLLTSENLSLDDLDFIAVGKGPGSFTGTRVGILTAKTLSFAKKLPLISFCSLARFTPLKTQPFLLLIDVKSQGFYVYDGKKASLHSQQALQIPKNIPLFSPHPDRIEKRLALKTTRVTANVLYLSNYLKEIFEKNQTISPLDLQVSYLHTPS